jgi:hypothetical protein
VGLWEKEPLKFDPRQHSSSAKPSSRKSVKAKTDKDKPAPPAKGFWERLFAR